ncbi:WD40 repeat domain-containing protein [Acidocella sp.]|uniref:WD40 repeat domain-containing protein n=1 Tax=Acidocella sp. TaxID=50710 RepID=UPI00261ADDB8|nr:WD40 repeat domain-containing protein [Acidocella sp.]
MSDDLDVLLKTRGQTAELGANVTAALFDLSGQAVFACGDGTLRLRDGDGYQTLQAHDGAVLALAAHPSGGVVSGGDDGRLVWTKTGEVRELAKFGSKWVEQLASFTGKGALIAAGVGKLVHLFDAEGRKLRELAHPSTVTGLAFDSKGKRIAAAHYNGASLWFTGSTAAPRVLEWKGSHTGVVLHPEGTSLVTSMQENALHGWTLPEGKHMRMSGYPAKTESMGFTKSGKWLATGGADTLVLWPFFGGGPMGKPPLELGLGEGIIKRVACHPQHEVVAVGFSSGLGLMIDVPGEKVLPLCAPGRGAFTALSWNAAGTHLAFGTDTGFVGLVNFSG